MAFQIEVSDDAELDADVILQWLIAQHAGGAGLRWFRTMRQAIDSLANMPGRCPLAPENEEFPFEVRQLLYGRRPHVYRILFTIEDNRVVVLHIRHGRRQHLTQH
jgi:plasmid stabilization system protein ParE